MENGFGSPYVKVYTSLGEITENITDFSYKYSQEEDDTCQLRIEKLDPNLADSPEFQEGALLSVVWGYLGRQEKVTRKVVIRNVKPGFTEETICLDILCTDRANRTKANSSKKIYSGTIEEMANEIGNKHGLLVSSVTQVNEDTLAIDGIAVTGVKKPSYFNTDGNFTSQVDNSVVVKNINMRIYEQLPQANRSDYQLLRDAAINDPNGPWEIYGRDDTLHVKPKNLNQKSIKTYKYGDSSGLVLSFYPETKNLTRQRNSSNVNIDAFNPENKSAYNIDINEFTNNVPKLGDVSDIPPRYAGNGIADSDDIAVVEEDVIVGPDNRMQVIKLPPKPNFGSQKVNSDKPLSNLRADITPLNDDSNKPENQEKTVDKEFEKDKADKFAGNYVLKNDSALIHFGILNTASEGFLNNDFNQVTAVDNTATIIKFGEVIDYSQNIPSSDHDIQEAIGKGLNAQANAALSKNPAELKVVGDPFLESGKILTMLGVSKKYSGNYYINECVHSIDRSAGWLVEMKLSKNALGSTQMDSPNKAYVDNFDKIPKIKKNTIINKEVGPTETDFTSTFKRLTSKDSNEPLSETIQ